MALMESSGLGSRPDEGAEPDEGAAEPEEDAGGWAMETGRCCVLVDGSGSSLTGRSGWWVQGREAEVGREEEEMKTAGDCEEEGVMTPALEETVGSAADAELLEGVSESAGETELEASPAAAAAASRILCVMRCCFMFPRVENPRPQLGQMKGLSPVWDL